MTTAGVFHLDMPDAASFEEGEEVTDQYTPCTPGAEVRLFDLTSFFGCLGRIPRAWTFETRGVS